MESSSAFKRISSANRDIKKIPAPLRSHISSPRPRLIIQHGVRSGWAWAEILRQNEIPRSYRIRTHNGEVRTRNRIHSRPNKFRLLRLLRILQIRRNTDQRCYSRVDNYSKTSSPVDESASDSQSRQESSSYEPYFVQTGSVSNQIRQSCKTTLGYVAKFCRVYSGVRVGVGRRHFSHVNSGKSDVSNRN
ncbi:hypothetical protein AVEN_451-1 [Araneus ventricosus]|uniref:Uncharacterized protein n=1 Tax=Araneus ventricosus TaxID=182803 RepID=A0A4Y2TB48_ARAVE|nr:hypothetical protein AVEN_451-1 [Araneus ventricosus]